MSAAPKDKTSFSAFAALAMARAEKRLAEKYEEPDLAARAETLEQRAQDAIDRGQANLSPLN